MFSLVLSSSHLVFIILSLVSSTEATPKFQRFQWGGIKGVVLSDGLFDFCGFPFLNMPQEEYLAQLRRIHRSAMPLRRAINVLVADVGKKRIMVDTGALNIPGREISFFFNAGELMKSMKMAGIHPHSIDAVLLTHGHFDHVLGLRTKHGTKAFPNADVYISKNEHFFWTNPTNNTQIAPQFLNILSNTYKASIAPYRKKNIRLITDGSNPFPGVRFRQSRGHSPGHMSIELGFGRSRLVVAGDVWALSAFQLKNLNLVGAIETNRAQLVLNRRKLLQRLSYNENLVLAYHETFPGLGFVENDTLGTYDWIPAPIDELDGDSSLKCN